MKISWTLIVIILALNSNCTKSVREDKIEYFDSNVKRLIGDNNLKLSQGVVVIPNAGCTGCIDQAILFVKDNIDSLKGFPIVFTSVRDRKLLKLTLGPVQNHRNIFFDNDNLLGNGLVTSNYPQFLVLDEGQVVDYIDDFQVNSILKVKNRN